MTATLAERTPRLRGSRTSVTAAVAAAVVAVLLITLFLVHRSSSDGTVWSDDFDGDAGSSPSAGNWILDVGTGYPGGPAGWGTGEIQTYTDDPANVALDGHGNLRITPTRDAAGAWRSARLETRRSDFRPEPGTILTVEARIDVPDGGQGYWAAFWMLGAPFRPSHTAWPGSGEIDVMEQLGSEPSLVHGTLHCGVYNGGPCDETTGLGGSRSGRTDGFHTYSIEWDRSRGAEEMRWYVDGRLYHRVPSSALAGSEGAAAWKQATDHGYFILLNVAVGGGWPGPPDATTRPGAPMLVDRVSVRQRDAQD
jgi:glycosyl hydrolase family 16